jgi:hypothetical protein
MSALMTFRSIMTCLLSALALAVLKSACVRYLTLRSELLSNMILKILKIFPKNNTKKPIRFFQLQKILGIMTAVIWMPKHFTYENIAIQ